MYLYKHVFVPECCNATHVFRPGSYIDRCACCNNITYLAGKFVSLRSKGILVRKVPAMTQGAGSALWARRAWLVNLQIDLHRDGGASALDRAAKQHKHEQTNERHSLQQASGQTGWCKSRFTIRGYAVVKFYTPCITSTLSVLPHQLYKLSYSYCSLWNIWNFALSQSCIVPEWWTCIYIQFAHRKIFLLINRCSFAYRTLH